MAFHTCKTCDFSFDPNDIASVNLLEANDVVMVIYKNDKIGNNGLYPISCKSITHAKEVYEEIAKVKEEYDRNTRPFATRG